MTAAPRVVFERGDSVPDFQLPDVAGNPTGLSIHSRGNPMVFAFFDGRDEAALMPFVAALGRLDKADVFIVTRLSCADNAALAMRLTIPVGVLADTEGRVSGVYSYAGDRPPPPITIYVLDRRLRVAAISRTNDPSAAVAATVAAVDGLAHLPAPVAVPRPAPLLTVPDVFDPALCRDLVQLWRTAGNFASGSFNPRANRDDGVESQTSKARRDHIIDDKELRGRIGNLIGRRVAPEVAKAFDFQVVGTTELKIARYGADTGGYFRAHRDNNAPATAFRRFAMSLLLNAPDDYTGGGLRFAEFGPEEYRPQAGEALIFSCSLLHEVMPVLEGERFVLLCFFFGARERQQLQQGNRK